MSLKLPKSTYLTHITDTQVFVKNVHLNFEEFKKNKNNPSYQSKKQMFKNQLDFTENNPPMESNNISNSVFNVSP